MKEKILKGKCKTCGNALRLSKSEINNKVDMRSLTRCPDGHAYCPVCHAPVKMK